MNDEPSDFNPPHEPMDTQLLQLERELFSLTPMEAPRHLASLLDQQLTSAVTPRPATVHPAAVLPFRWHRIVVPAAAAVVVVSVLNRMDHPTGLITDSAVANPGMRSDAPVATPAHQVNSGYVLKAEPLYFHPTQGEGTSRQFYIQSGASDGHRNHDVAPRRLEVMPSSFH